LAGTIDGVPVMIGFGKFCPRRRAALPRRADDLDREDAGARIMITFDGNVDDDGVPVPVLNGELQLLGNTPR
jgi:hypothetical protein